MTICKNTHRVGQYRYRRLAFYFLVFALVLRSLIPAGFMPHFDADSSRFVSIEICTPEGAYLIDVPIDGDASDNKQHTATNHQEPCAFGSFVQQFFASELSSAEIAFSPYTSLVIVTEQRVDFPVFSIFGAPIGSRAPPVSATV